MREVITKIYKIDELTREQQEKAHENYINSREYAWTAENRQTLEAFADVFPVVVKDWEYDAQSFNVRFEMTCDDCIENLSGQRLATYIWNNYKSDLFKGKYYSTRGQWIEGEYKYKSRHSRIILDNSGVLTGYCLDDDILQPVYEFLNKPDNRNFEELMSDCFDAWGKAVVNECESQLSFEYFLEHAEANEYEFDEDGEQVY